MTRPVCYQVIIIQPQAPSSTEGSPGVQADVPSQEAPPAPKSPSQKKDEDPEVRRSNYSTRMTRREQIIPNVAIENMNPNAFRAFDHISWSSSGLIT